MKNLFDLLDAIITTGHQDEILADADQMVSFAENCNMFITSEIAESVISAHNEWVSEVSSGNGEWERMRHGVEVKLECYANIVSGEVATVDMLIDEYNSMGAELWFGKESTEGLDWLNDAGFIHVEWDGSEWAEA